jgi:hypothetical protein
LPIGFRYYEEAEISAGAFGGSPAVPSDKVTTVSTNVLLVSRASLSNHAAGELTRLLLATKTRLAATWSRAGQLAAPKTDKDALLPAHPGTIAFLNGEQSDLLDRSTNLILLTSVLTGFVGWLAAGLNTLRKGHEVRRRIQQLTMLLAQANASEPEQLGAIEQEAAQLSDWLRQRFIANEISPRNFHGAEAGVAHIAALIRRKRWSASLDQLEHFFERWQSAIATARAAGRELSVTWPSRSASAR